MIVVFPAPFGPKKPKHSPPKTSKSTPLTASKPEQLFFKPRASSVDWPLRAPLVLSVSVFNRQPLLVLGTFTSPDRPAFRTTQGPGKISGTAHILPYLGSRTRAKHQRPTEYTARQAHRHRRRYF